MVGNDVIRPRRTPMPLFGAPGNLHQVGAYAPKVPAPPMALSASLPLADSLHIKSRLGRHGVVAAAVLCLIIGDSGLLLASRYYSAHLAAQTAALEARLARSTPVSPFYELVPAAQLSSKLNTLSSQPANLTIGSTSVTIPASTVRSWLEVSYPASRQTAKISVNTIAIRKSLQQIAKDNTVQPVNEVTATHGGVTSVISIGSNGIQPGNVSPVINQFGRNLLGGRGLAAVLPITTIPFQRVAPAAFDKLIEVDLAGKTMYLYQNGQVVKTIPISAGKPSTPTPIGEFHIWAKLPEQTMRGPGYVQPDVPWVNYFDHSGDAVHGAYWRSASVYGNVNASHGCVEMNNSTGLAEWVYNWAPIGTTVITYN